MKVQMEGGPFDIEVGELVLSKPEVPGSGNIFDRLKNAILGP
jgi:hypothetical protein